MSKTFSPSQRAAFRALVDTSAEHKGAGYTVNLVCQVLRSQDDREDLVGIIRLNESLASYVANQADIESIDMKPVVSRGNLSTMQVLQLDLCLQRQGLSVSSPYSVPQCVISVCLNCGSVSRAADTQLRDKYSEEYENLTCCGTVVRFHSRDRVLADPSKLTFLKQ
jgi:hypothetical protein